MATIAAPRPLPRESGPPSELNLAFLTIAGITVLYLIFVLWQGVPRASGIIGHSIGIMGFVLMLMTETLYSIRKRQRRKAWGRMNDWLRFHIFTGIVGPYMVFLHAAWSFKGLAGVTLLLTGIVVLSGFVGRFIYTAVPRTPDGVILEAGEIRVQLLAAEAELGCRMRGTDGQDHLPNGSDRPRSFVSHLPTEGLSRAEQAQLRALLSRRKQLERQTASLATARRMMALWHSIHVPLGIALFVSALIHAVAALYYATLIR